VPSLDYLNAVLLLRLIIAAAAAGILSFVVGTPELLTLLILFLPTFGIVFWGLGFLLKKDS
jgi:hypothetical protein